MTHDNFLVYQKLDIEIVSELAKGLGEYLFKFKQKNSVLLSEIKETCIEAMLELLQEHDYGFTAFFYNPSIAKAEFKKVLDSSDWNFQCVVIQHTKDAISIAQAATNAGYIAAVNNASDQKVLLGKGGEHFEAVGQGLGGKYAGEEHQTATMTILLLHGHLNPSAYVDKNRITNTNQLDLINAIQERNYKKVRDLIKDGVNVNCGNARDVSPLQIALGSAIQDKESYQIALELIDAGASNETNGGFVPIATAIENGFLEVVKKFIARGLNVIQPMERCLGKSPLEYAEELKETGSLNTPAHHQIYQKILEAKAAKEKGLTLLIEAIKAGDIEKIKELIKDGADVNIPDANSTSPLQHAILENKPNIATELINQGASNNTSKGFPPIYLAIQAEQVEVVKALVEKGKIDINEIPEGYAESPLKAAESKFVNSTSVNSTQQWEICHFLHTINQQQKQATTQQQANGQPQLPTTQNSSNLLSKFWSKISSSSNRATGKPPSPSPSTPR